MGEDSLLIDFIDVSESLEGAKIHKVIEGNNLKFFTTCAIFLKY
jgi:hypothetical protein